MILGKRKYFEYMICINIFLNEWMNWYVKLGKIINYGGGFFLRYWN